MAGEGGPACITPCAHARKCDEGPWPCRSDHAGSHLGGWHILACHTYDKLRASHKLQSEPCKATQAHGLAGAGSAARPYYRRPPPPARAAQHPPPPCPRHSEHESLALSDGSVQPGSPALPRAVRHGCCASPPASQQGVLCGCREGRGRKRLHHTHGRQGVWPRGAGGCKPYGHEARGLVSCLTGLLLLCSRPLAAVGSAACGLPAAIHCPCCIPLRAAVAASCAQMLQEQDQGS